LNPRFLSFKGGVVVKGKCQGLVFSDFVSHTPSATRAFCSFPSVSASLVAAR
jgi:hypothetical protein